MNTAGQHAFLVRLLFDEELREQFFSSPEATAQEAGLGAAELEALRTIDRTGLEVDAEIRRDYLMSALCRAYPLTAAAIGSSEGGAKKLSSFMASPKLVAEPHARSQAFGDHLARLLSFGLDMPPVWTGLVESLLSLERGLVDAAARLRAYVEQGNPPPTVRRPSAAERKRGRLKTPPFFVAAELPVPTSLVKGALDQVGPEDAWHRIASGRLLPERLLTVARADAMPVTVLARAVVRGAPVGSVIEVSHITAELNGRHAGTFARLEGTALNEVAAGERGMLERLVDAGVVEIVRATG